MIRPLIPQRADPFLTKHNGVYYFTASVPEYDRIELRSSETVGGLAAAKPRAVWSKHAGGPMSYHIWAPELHLIDGVWHIYFAAGEAGNIWEIRPYALRCGGEPMTGAWTECGPMQAAEGDDAFTDFSLDGTVFTHKGKRYFVWAEKVGRQFGVSNLYIAEMETPVKLKTARVLLSTPEYGWERVGFRVNEGAAVLSRGGKVFISYSASATGAMYCMGLLCADGDADLLDPASWSKESRPVLATDAARAVYGPGHNSFCADGRGGDLCVFHARQYAEIEGDPLNDPNRHTFVMRVRYDGGGKPLFDLSETL
jgi:GH43 family beta-xylosidase